MHFPQNRRYNSFVGYFKEKYGNRLQKIVVDAGFTCPNRDGKISTGGCTFCNNDAFHPSYSTSEKAIIDQLNEGIVFHQKRYRNASNYLAYFQSYSNTYASIDILEKRYSQALSHPLVAGIVIGTRPDCIDNDKLSLLKDIAKEKIVIVEYGVESIYNHTLKRINRGHTIECAIETINKTAEYGLDQGAHFIFGLPGESKEQMLNYAHLINTLPLNSVKFHQLQIVKNTFIEEEYNNNNEDFIEMSLDEYINFFIDFLEILKPEIHIERFAGEVPPRFVNKTPWGKIRNVELIRLLEKRLEERSTFQGARFSG